MNTKELKGQRIRKGKSQTDMANALDITLESYQRRERGKTKFSPEQIAIVARELEFPIKITNKVFFDDKLPIG